MFDLKDSKTTEDNKSTDDANYIDQLVGEGKKYSSIEELAKAKYHADQHISRIEEENKGMREISSELSFENRKLKEDMTMLESKVNSIFDKVDQQTIQKQNTETSKEESTQKPVEENTPLEEENKSTTENNLEEIVMELLQKNQQQTQTQVNLKESNDFAVAKFGSEEAALKAVETKAKSLNMSMTDIQELAGKSPDAFKSLLGEVAKNKTDQTTFNQSSQNFSSVPLASEEDPEHIAYYNKMRRTDRNRFYSPDVQGKLFELQREGKLRTS
tara:strand:+ start:6104 stop:6919 length:816 start_codon:yes stop_codon:yes gene_type:complete